MKKNLLILLLSISCAAFTLSGCTASNEPVSERASRSKTDTNEDEDNKKKESDDDSDEDKNASNEDENSTEDEDNSIDEYPEEDYYEDDCGDNVLNYVTVNNTQEFMDAIAPNTIIYLTPGEYNLTEWAYDVFSDNEIQSECWYGNYVSISDSFDGPEVKLSYLENLYIYNDNPEELVSIVCEPRYSCVMNFDYCTNIHMSDLTMGHTTEEGYCTGAVIGINNGLDFEFYNMDLYGCGTYGISAYDTDHISLHNSTIHDCSYGCLELNSCKSVYCEDSSFIDCAEAFNAFDIYNTGLDLSNCYFNNLPEVIFAMDNISYVRILDGTFVGDIYDNIINQVEENNLPVLIQVSNNKH